MATTSGEQLKREARNYKRKALTDLNIFLAAGLLEIAEITVITIANIDKVQGALLIAFISCINGACMGAGLSIGSINAKKANAKFAESSKIGN